VKQNNLAESAIPGLTGQNMINLPTETSMKQAKPAGDFRGNKAALPAKQCAACGRLMVWRKKWRLNWHSVIYCSNACRKGFKSA